MINSLLNDYIIIFILLDIDVHPCMIYSTMSDLPFDGLAQLDKKEFVETDIMLSILKVIWHYEV